MQQRILGTEALAKRRQPSGQRGTLYFRCKLRHITTPRHFHLFLFHSSLLPFSMVQDFTILTMGVHPLPEISCYLSCNQ
jgi:hypothetical protein